MVEQIYERTVLVKKQRRIVLYTTYESDCLRKMILNSFKNKGKIDKNE